MGVDALLYLALILVDLPPRTSVSVEGDATVQLVDQHGVHHEAGPLQPGVYTVLATFPGRKTRRAAHIYLPADQQVTLRCVSGFYKCSVVDPQSVQSGVRP